jgi:hypothetical protein
VSSIILVRTATKARAAREVITSRIRIAATNLQDVLHESLASSYRRLQCAISRNDRSVGFPSRQSVEHFRETRLVRITHRGFAVGLDPFGMLDPQIVVNLLLELGIRVDWIRHGYRPR